MFDEPGRRAPLDLARHSDGFVFHRDIRCRRHCLRWVPGVRIVSRLGRRQRNVDDDQSFERKPGMDERVFPGPALAPVSGDRVAAVARGGAAMDRALGLAGLVRPRIDPTDIGFIIGTSFGNGYRLTGDPSYKDVLTLQANHWRRSTIRTVGAVRSWTFGPWQFPVIIDSMMTLGPLQWGAGNGGSSAWAGIAATHAQTVTTNLVRSDGSTFQLADFDPTTGALLSQGTFAGYSDTSTWARGQAWALYGFVQAYQTSDNPAFLTTAEDVANYFVGHLLADDMDPPLGFRRAGGATCGHFGGGHRGGRARHAEHGCGTSALRASYLHGRREHTGVAQQQLPRPGVLASRCCSMASRAGWDEYRADLRRLLFHRSVAAIARRARWAARLGAV